MRISKFLFAVFGAYAVINGAIITVGLTVVGVMFVVIGNTPGRVIGVGLLTVVAIPWLRAVRAVRQSYRRATHSRV